jgi:hypothetical protein
MPRFEAGDHIGKAAMNIQISGQLLQAAPGTLPVRSPSLSRGRSRRGGRFHKQRNCTAHPAREYAKSGCNWNLSK